MARRHPPINSEPVNEQARSDLLSLIEDYKLPATVEHVKRFARLSAGKRGTLAWLEHLRLTGLLLATLDDEEWQLFTTAYLPQHPANQPKPPRTQLQPETGCVVGKDLF